MKGKMRHCLAVLAVLLGAGSTAQAATQTLNAAYTGGILDRHGQPGPSLFL